PAVGQVADLPVAPVPGPVQAGPGRCLRVEVVGAGAYADPGAGEQHRADQGAGPVLRGQYGLVVRGGGRFGGGDLVEERVEGLLGDDRGAERRAYRRPGRAGRQRPRPPRRAGGPGEQGGIIVDRLVRGGEDLGQPTDDVQRGQPVVAAGNRRG